MKSYFGIILLVSFFSFNCKNDSFKKENYKNILIDNSKIDKVKDISDLIDTIKIIPLKEQSPFHFSSVFKLLVSKGNYLIYDRFNVNKVFLFDSLGHFQKIVCKVGNSPNDPLNMNDIWLNNNGELEVYDFAQMKILKFDSNYNYAFSVKAPKLYHFVCLINIPNTSNYIGYANYNYYNKPFDNKLFSIAFLNPSLNIFKVDLLFDKKYEGIPWFTYNQHFFRFGDSLRFIKAYDNIVYEIANESISEKYKIIYKMNNMEKSALLNIIDRHLLELKDRKTPLKNRVSYMKKYTTLKGPWLESENLIIIHSVDTIGEFGSSFITIVDKRKSFLSYSFRKMTESRRFMMEIPPFEYYDDKMDEYISVVPGIILKKLLFNNSVYKNLLTNNPYDFYIIKTKFTK
jgi:hypothetical protein